VFRHGVAVKMTGSRSHPARARQRRVPKAGTCLDVFLVRLASCMPQLYHSWCDEGARLAAVKDASMTKSAGLAARVTPSRPSALKYQDMETVSSRIRCEVPVASAQWR
jgi:hypothetical protein